MAASHHQPYTSCMLPLSASLEEMRDRHEREFAAMHKTLRRERWSLFTFLFAWMIYVSILPFVRSPDLIMFMLGILLLFYAQFLVVMLMD